MQSTSTSGSAGSAAPMTSNTENYDSDGPGFGTLMERFHGVTKRETPLKRKSQEIEDNNGDEMQKKAKTTFNSKGSGGEMGEYLKAEREKAASESAQITETIDLTNDDDGDNDDEVIITGVSRVNDDEIVCMGRLYAKANAFRIPMPSKKQDGSLGAGMWPIQRLDYKRNPVKNDYRIDIMDKASVKFGYLDMRIASVLCPLLDADNLSNFKIKIYLDQYPKEPGDFAGKPISKVLSVSILLYAPRKKVETIGRWLSQRQHFLSAPPDIGRSRNYVNPHEQQTAFGTTKTNAVRRPQSSQPNFASRSQEELKRDATTIIDELALQSQNLPEMEPNTTIIKTTLMSHQKQALHFMVEHEHGDRDTSHDNATTSLWKEDISKRGLVTYYHILTGHRTDEKPEPERGGILADVMGLGKTLTILSLIANTLDEAKQFGESAAPMDALNIERNAKTTLIICPKSVMSNWEEQIRMHTRSKRLKIYSYHGTSRNRDLDELADYDIVLTTYSTTATEYSDKREGRNTLKGIQWFRVVLDEGHQIRTQSTKVSQACCALAAQRRWVLTGTPVQNRLDDVGSLFRFLHIKPFDDKDSWGRHIAAPLRNGNEQALQSLRVLMGSVTLRRQKDKVGLAEKKDDVIRLEFSEEERRIYAEFASQGNLELKKMLSKDSRLHGKSYAHVLRSLYRLRAICAHGAEMLSEEDKKLLEGATASRAIELGDDPENGPNDDFISEKHAYDTLHMMIDGEVDECSGCNRKISERTVDSEVVTEDSEDSDSDSTIGISRSSSTDPLADVMGYLTPCYHLFCPDCKDKYVHDSAPRFTRDEYYTCIYCEQYVRYGLFELRRSGLQAMLDARDKTKQKGKQAKWDEATYSGPHTKVKALLAGLKQSAEQSALLPPDEPPIRSVVFSGWVQYLDLIEHALEQHNIKFVRIDGSMSIKARSQVLKDFRTDTEITVLLVSIKAGGQGLNFTAANKVYMMEPQYNPGVELQAIDRVHRIGQERNVEIVHYIMTDSVEEKILELQKKKMELARMTVEKNLSKAEEAKQKIDYLRALFK